MILEKAVFNSGKIRDARRLAAMESSLRVITREGRWSSDAFMVHMKVNIEHPRWVSKVL